MASIRKSFSFRNGVQVDEDNFVVNANGLVGIGTSVPSAFLDVRGTAKVVGLTTTNDLFVSGVATATDIKVGTAISITGGGIKATNFYGDGATLSNLPTSQWEDVDVGLGYTSIYAVGNVGIATTDPRQSFQVGGSPDILGNSGVGINSIGNIKATGIVTASGFVGAISGPVTGDVTGNVTGDVTGNLTGNVTGNVNSSGKSTFADIETGQINVTGVSTFAGTVNSTGRIVGAATSNVIPFLYSDLASLPSASTYHGAFAHVHATGKAYFAHAGQWWEIVSKESNGVIGNGTDILNINQITVLNELKVGAGGTALSLINSGKLGIGTATPSKDVTIKKVSDTSVEVVSESGVSNISIGLTGETKNKGILRFNNDANAFDIVNNDTGDLNFVLDGDSNGGTGDIRFFNVNLELMRLTHDGNLGIAVTNPSHRLHVVGTSTVTGNAFIGGNLSVGGTISGRLALGQTLEANIFTTTGVSTFAQVNVIGPIGFASATPAVDVDFQQATASFGSVGIGTTNPTGKLKVVGDAFFDSIGINTTLIQTDPSVNVGALQIAGEKIRLIDSQIKFDFGRTSQIGFGTVGDSLTGTVDLRRSGLNNISPWVFLPEITTGFRNAKTIATGTQSSGIGTGAIIYNSSTQNVEIYLPDGDTSQSVNNWVGIATGVGGGGVTVQDEGSALSTTATTLNFVGSGVVASGTGSTKTITISGGGGGISTAGVTVQDEGSALSTAGTTLNFVGGGVVASGTGSTKTITISGGGSGVTLQDEGTPLSTLGTTLNFVGSGVVASGTGSTKTITISGGGGGLQSRATANASTSSIGVGSSANITINAAKTYALQKIQTSAAAWVTVYTDTTSRTNDASRGETTDPTPGSGVIAEVITSGATTQILSPGVIGYNNDGTPSSNVYLKVVNKSGSTQAITVTLHYLQLES